MYEILIIYWILFGISHSVLAAVPVKSFFRRVMGSHFRFYRLYYSIFSFLLLGWILWFHSYIPDKLLMKFPQFVTVLAYILLVPAILIMLFCIKKYFFHLSGIDALFPRKQQQDVLETGGLNSYVRHPLYSGTLLLVICIFLIHSSAANLISASMIILYTCIGAYFEEKKLRRDFGEAYSVYQRQVPMLIPFIKRRKLK